MTKKPFLPALLWMLLITALSVLPGASLPKFDLFSADKPGHALAYGVLVWLLLRAWRQSGRTPTRASSLGILLFAVGYGVLMEGVQGAFIPGRHFDYDDMIANTFGALLAWAIRMLRPPKN